MSRKPEKIWEKPWSTEEIISKADNWSLAGDVALLHSFQKFAHNMFLKTDEISKNLDSLLSNTDQVQLKLSMCQNEFHSLKNTQFIESRVYEDDETLDSREKEMVEEKVSSEEEKEKMMLDAIADGLKVMEEYYDKVEVDVSDSEEETEKSFILKPKDIYVHRQLPPVIGTDEWFKKWHLAEESSDSESDKVSDVYSESDSEECLPKHLLKGSETSSEIDTSSRISGSIPTANSGLSASVKKQAEISSSDESSEGRGSLPVKTPISSQSFAEQLSAKLGSVISQREDVAHVSENVNTRPIQSTTNRNYIGGLFPDEPPPLDQSEEILPKISKSDPNMLDENDDDLFWGERPKQKFGQDKLFGHDTIHQDVKDEEGFKNPTKTSQIARGLFDSDDSSDESDIFAGNVKGLSKQPFLQGFKSSVPLFDDSPPDLDEKIKAERTTDKKPVGGVSIFGNTNIFAKQSISDVLENKRTQRSSNESTVEPSQNKSETLPKSEQSLNDKKLSTKPSLFDDDFEDDEVDFTVSKKKVDLFETGNKSTTTTSKKLNLFDDSVSEEDTDKTLRVVPKKVSLFNDSLSEEEVGIVKIPSIPTTAKPTAKKEVGENDSVASKNVSLFSDPSPEKEDSSKDRIPKASKKISLFDDDDDLFKDDIFSSLVPGSSGKGLFDDLDDADLFGVNSMEKESEAKLNSKSKKVSLFSDNEDEEDIFESKTVNTHSLLDEPKRAVSVFSEDELKIDKVETKLTSSRPDQEHHTEKKEEAKSLEKEREESGAENVSEKSEDKKREKNSGVDHEQMPRGVDNDVAQKDETLPHTESNDHLLSESKAAEPKVDTLFEPQSSNAILSSTKEEPKEQKPVISLYSSAPPSDDEDDWDTRSDNMSDTDEYRPYSIDDNVSRSSLFDNEPPSLNPNESSGIVRDQNVTRLDSDDSSFYPHASSSKRFSSDIFAEQQSQDKLFVTGSTIHSNVFPSSTESSSISEVTNKIISDIMGDTSFLITDNTLESTSTAHGLTEECSTTTDDAKIADGSIKTKATKIKEMIEQRNSESTASKKSEKGDGDAKRGDSSKISSKRGSPLKIKPNLNINVSALLPGSLPPKLKTPGASESGDKEKSVLAEKKHIQTINTPTEKLPRDPISRSLPPPLPSSSEEYIEKPLSFDDKLEKVEVLHSVTKDRARIAVKRKPSTRKARQEAVRTSAIFLEDEDRDESSTNKDTSVVEKDVDKKSETEKDNGGKPLFIEDSKTSTNSKTETKTIKSTSLLLESDELGSEEADNTPKLTIKSSTKLKSEDDCSGSKKNETTIPSENEEISSKSSKDNIDRDKTKPLFDESAESEEEDFFKPTSKKPANTKTSLFDSGDGSDGNLFGSKTDKSGSEKKTEAQKPAKKKSLFDDSSSDDDLFAGGKSRNAVSGTSTKKSGRATKKNSSLKKLDTGKASEDPLSKLSD
nr:unnamed protein product [Callosobruchus chinensis]